MKIQQKKLEIAIYLKEIWHDPIKETPKKDGALCIVSIGVDEEGKDTYDLFPWDEKMKAFDTGVGHYIDEDLKTSTLGFVQMDAQNGAIWKTCSRKLGRLANAQRQTQKN